MSNAASLAFNACRGECRNHFNKLHEGRKPSIAAGATLVNIVALAIFTILFATGVIPTWAPMVAFGSLVVIAAAIYGPRLLWDDIPKLVKIVGGYLIGKPQTSIDGSYVGIKGKYGQYFDKGLCDAVATLCEGHKFASLLDAGCGDGKYVHQLNNDLKGTLVQGYDGNPSTIELTNNECKVQSLTTPFTEFFDCIMSIEVGEKIPKNLEQNFINNISNNASHMIIMSWGHPGQGGHAHQNERSQEEVAQEFTRRGWTLDGQASQRLRDSCHRQHYWLKQNIQVFVKSLS